MEHIETADTCRGRFEAWPENINDDMGSTWTGNPTSITIAVAPGNNAQS